MMPPTWALPLYVGGIIKGKVVKFVKNKDQHMIGTT
jgi:hypothetical protein